MNLATQMASPLARPPAWRLFAVSVFLFSMVFVINPGGFHTDYGNGGGRWEDRVDAYSDRLVVNKVLDDAYGNGECRTGFMVFTKGYQKGDFSYYPDGTTAYYSHFGLPARVLSFGRSVLGVHSDHGMTRYLDLARLLMVVATAAILALFVTRLGRECGTFSWFLATLLIASSAGLAIFSHNLYFFIPALLLPFGISTLGYGRLSRGALFLLILPAAVLNFLCRYEFTTTFAVLATVPFFAFRPNDSLADKLKHAATAFVATIAGFVIAFTIHIGLAAQELGGIQAALFSVVERVAYRTLSVEEVVPPFSSAFFGTLRTRWSNSGLALPYSAVSVSEIGVLALYCVVPLFLRPAGWRVFALWGIGLFAYGSWYVFAYQHILWHGMYDWLIFSISIVPVLAVFMARLGTRLPPQVKATVLVLLVLAVFCHRFKVHPPPDTLGPAAAIPPAGQRAEIVASDIPEQGWNRGIRKERGRTNQFHFTPDGNVDITPGTRLFFAGSGWASVTAIVPQKGSDGVLSALVTTDRNLWPARDGAPNPIRVY